MALRHSNEMGSDDESITSPKEIAGFLHCLLKQCSPQINDNLSPLMFLSRHGQKESNHNLSSIVSLETAFLNIVIRLAKKVIAVVNRYDL